MVKKKIQKRRQQGNQNVGYRKGTKNEKGEILSLLNSVLVLPATSGQPEFNSAFLAIIHGWQSFVYAWYFLLFIVEQKIIFLATVESWDRVAYVALEQIWEKLTFQQHLTWLSTSYIHSSYLPRQIFKTSKLQLPLLLNRTINKHSRLQ